MKPDNETKSRDAEPPQLDALTPELQIALPRNWSAAAAAILALVVIAWLLVGRRGDAPQLDPSDALEQDIRKDGRRAERESDSVCRIAWQEQQTLVNEGMTMLDNLFRAWNEHQQKLAALLDSTDGQRIASDPALVDQFAAIRDGSGPTATRHAKLYANAATLLRPDIDEALRAKVIISPPKPEFDKQVRAFHEGAVKQDAELGAWIQQLAGLVARTHNLPAEGPSLRAVLAERDARETQRHNEEVTRQWKVREKQLSDQRDADVLAAREAKKKSDDRTEVVGEQERAARSDAARVAAEQQAAAAEKHRQRLAQFHKELPDIRSQLTPFITPGKMQLGQHGWETSSEAAPLSWSAIRGVLGAPGDRRSAAFLANAFGELDSKNDRPFGSFPRRYQPDLDAAAMARLVEFLHANGDLMVEEGLLKP